MTSHPVTIIPARPTVTETSFGVWKVQMPGELKDTIVYRYAGAFWKCTEHRPRQDCAHIAAILGTLKGPKPSVPAKHTPAGRLATAVIDHLENIEGHDGGCHEQERACPLCTLVELAHDALPEPNAISLPESALAAIVKRLADLQYLRTNPTDVLMLTDELLTAIERRDWGAL